LVDRHDHQRLAVSKRVRQPPAGDFRLGLLDGAAVADPTVFGVVAERVGVAVA